EVGLEEVAENVRRVEQVFAQDDVEWPRRPGLKTPHQPLGDDGGDAGEDCRTHGRGQYIGPGYRVYHVRRIAGVKGVDAVDRNGVRGVTDEADGVAAACVEGIDGGLVNIDERRLET